VINIETDRISAFGDTDPESAFVLVTNQRLVDEFTLTSQGKYSRTLIVPYDGEEPFSSLFGAEIPPRSHILTILPDCLMQSIPRELLADYKILIMACRSGQIGLDGIAHFLKCGYSSDLQQQLDKAEEFFNKGQESQSLVLLNDSTGSSCSFAHLSDEYEWHEQTGLLNWGDQQVYPAGEIACFAVPLYIEDLDQGALVGLNGTMTLSGQPIVQSGPPSFLLKDQLRIYTDLATVKSAPLILDIRDGTVVDHHATGPESLPAERMLSSLFAVDSRYRNVYEIGFSINEQLELWDGNAAMNEVWGHGGGNIHMGLGMLPHTQYHIDVFCVGTRVENEKGEHLFGRRVEATTASGLRRVKSAGCPCLQV
jgi:hypothetical protein